MKTKLIQSGMTSLVVGMLVIYGCNKDDNSINSESLPAVADASVAEITITSVIIKGAVLYGDPPVNSRGICWSADPEPTIDDNMMIEGSGTGLFSGKISGLTPGTRYYVRIFATNIEGTAYSKSLEINTPLTASPATLETIPITDLSGTMVLAGGKIINNGYGEIIEKGICWSTGSTPTVDDAKIVALNGTNAFALQISDLEPGTVYYVRAYAINSAGLSYGPVVTFRTPITLGQRMSDFPGAGGLNLASFSIGNKVYMGLGYDSLDDPTRDFWEWDENSDHWTRISDLPVYTMERSTTFTINDRGYILANVNTDDGIVNQLWEFDPARNVWTRMADLPETPARFYATGFAIGNKGYVGLGTKGFSYDLNEFYSDFWEWDQQGNTWTRKSDFPGGARAGAVGFSIGTKGYVGTGDGNSDFFRDGLTGYAGWSMPQTGHDGLYNDLWEYDQAGDTWTRNADFMGSARKGAIGFSVGSKGYIGLGYDPMESALPSQDIWMWDQASDSWVLAADFIATPRIASTGGTVGNMFYLAGGIALTGGETGFYSILNLNDLWVIDLAGTSQ